jgi:D-glycero-alpha-D-manno-heptose-7-phosphate kinase
MYILIHPFFDERIQVKYSRTELVNSIAHIQHPIVRMALEQFRLEGVDINSIADIPAGTGLGSSCSFTVGLLHALYAYTGRFASKELLAQKACEIEIDVLKDPIGKQDQYAAAYGGLNLIAFYPDESVQVTPVVMPAGCRRALADNLLMFYLGGSRSAGEILGEQQKNIHRDKAKYDALGRMSELAKQLHAALATGSIDDMGPILDDNWRLKKTLASQISDGWIDECYENAKRNGATGGKLLGAGGGGFLLLYCPKENQEKLLCAMSDIRRMTFDFDSAGSTIIHYEERAR